MLLWVVLRHVAYDSPHGKKLYAITFPDNNQSAAAGAKESWLDSDVFDFSIPGNAPLTDLIREVAEMLENATKHLNGINYDTFLAPFEIALQRNDWPDNDAALPYVTVDGERFSSGGKISVPALRRHLEARGLRHPA